MTRSIALIVQLEISRNESALEQINKCIVTFLTRVNCILIIKEERNVEYWCVNIYQYIIDASIMIRLLGSFPAIEKY